MAIEYKKDYELLELSPASNWELAQANYRRLVHHWHPDRYAQRPRERAFAQQKFIALTKSFNSLRIFYRQHQYLPLQRLPQTANATEQRYTSLHEARPLRQKNNTRRSKKYARPSMNTVTKPELASTFRRPTHAKHINKVGNHSTERHNRINQHFSANKTVEDFDVIESSILNKRKIKRKNKTSLFKSAFFWAALSFIALLGTVVTLRYIDRMAKQNTLEEGIRFLQNTKPSVYSTN